MNRNKLKTYAPKARRDFIAAVTARATKFGITKNAVEPVQVQGNVAVIAGQAHPKKVAEQRAKLETRIKTRGFEQVMEEAAYTWFNRFAAIRYMEVHGYLDHGYRVLSHPEGKATPEIVEHAQHLELPGLDKGKVIELKLDGTKEGELYRMLLVAQCNALHAAMPFLFERIDDETELLLPDNLLHSDSVIRQMVTEIDEEDWQEIEIIGWLYQFYISEKKDQVIGKVVKSEDIPAATQLFTPNWIVKYMVQNTLGAKWLATYPQSGIRAKMEYYIEPAEQTEDVKAKLAEITPRELNPEEITFLDPACGSGHILVEAYDLFKEIYLERGYVLRDIPRLILEKNLFGLDIDDRAAQMAAFALLMKARTDDRRILNHPAIMNVMAFRNSEGLDPAEICRLLAPDEQFELVRTYDLLPETIAQPTLATRVSPKKLIVVNAIVDAFRDAQAFGSLAKISDVSASTIDQICAATSMAWGAESIFHKHVLDEFSKLLFQAKIITRKYDCVVANPPYMGSKSMCDSLRRFGDKNYKEFKSDLFSMFIAKISEMTAGNGYIGIMSPFVWMFLSSYEGLRLRIINNMSILSLVHPEYHSFFDSAYVPVCTFVIRNAHISMPGSYFNLQGFVGAELQPVKLKEAINDGSSPIRHNVYTEDFLKVPGAPIAYWVSQDVRDVYENAKLVSDLAEPKQGLATGDNDQFLRFWHEVDFSRIGLNCESRASAAQSGKRWFPCTKGGDYRKWYGNNEYVVDWEGDGMRLRNFKNEKGKLRSRPQNLDYYFRRGMSWSTLTISSLSMRLCKPGFLFETKGSMCFPIDDEMTDYLLAFFNTKLVNIFLSATSPTLDYHEGPLGRLPVVVGNKHLVDDLAKKAVEFSKRDWDSTERSWDFTRPRLVQGDSLPKSYLVWENECSDATQNLADIETKINASFINVYGLSKELDAAISTGEVTLQTAENGRDIRHLTSYSIGCMMGRYSLDETGLIYANSGNVGFDANRYTTFPADDDGIVPIMQTDWFDDDAANRFVEFVKVAWSPETLAENLKFVADSLGAKAGETPIDTIRRYLSADFFKDHLKTYKKRPIYWLFSSGKEKAFEALVYLHRYNEGTLSRMRMEYVTPLQGRISARIDQLDRDIAAAGSTAQQNKLRKEQEKLKKQQAELIKFDEQLRHYADMRIKLDLDDGVKVNYGKFGTLLAEVKAITGGSDE